MSRQNGGGHVGTHACLQRRSCQEKRVSEAVRLVQVLPELAKEAIGLNMHNLYGLGSGWPEDLGTEFPH